MVKTRLPAKLPLPLRRSSNHRYCHTERSEGSVPRTVRLRRIRCAQNDSHGITCIGALAAIVLLLALAGCALLPGGSGPVQKKAEPFSGERAYEHVRYLSIDIGSRPASTDNAREAAGYIAGQFRSEGLEVDRPKFEYRTYTEKKVKLEVVQPAAESIEARSLVYSAAGEMTTEVVDAGDGRSEDFPGLDLKGKIALMRRGQITFAAKVSNAAAVGAVGAIVYNHVGGELRGSLGQPSAIPAVAITLDDGRRLQSLAGQGRTVAHLLVDAETSLKTSENVVGAKRNKGGKVLIVGAHYDSVEEGPGANDNASGVATVIELARVTSAPSYPFTLRFMAFGAEELGLVGSGRYVESMDGEERKKVVAMINFDMVGVGDDLRFGGDKRLVQLATAIAKELGLEAKELDEKFVNASDNASFREAGIPSLFVHWQDDPNYHTKNDVAEFVRPDRLNIAGKVAIALLDRLAKEEGANGEGSAMDRRKEALVPALSKRAAR